MKKKSTKSAKRKSTVGGGKKPKKRAKKETNNDEENEENEELEEEGGANESNEEVESSDEIVDSDENKENAAQQGNNPATAAVDLERLSIHFREFDLSVIGFVNLDIEIAEIVPDTGSDGSDGAGITSSAKLKPHIFQMIISDFNQKLTLVLKSSSMRAAPSAPAGFGPPSALASSSKPTKMSLFLSHNPINPLDLVNLLF